MAPPGELVPQEAQPEADGFTTDLSKKLIIIIFTLDIILTILNIVR